LSGPPPSSEISDGPKLTRVTGRRKPCWQRFLLATVVEKLANDEALNARLRDHNLGGNWREHLKPDLLLIYKHPDSHILRLVRMGSHSEMFTR